MTIKHNVGILNRPNRKMRLGEKIEEILMNTC